MMKETYKRTELELIEFLEEDILVDSIETEDDEVDIRGFVSLR